MKNFVKKLLILVTVSSLVVGAFAIPVKADAKNTYWLSGVSKAAGGHMNMYYKGNTIVLKGKFRKSASRNKIYDVAEKKYSYSLKVADNCKVTFVEAENNETITYKKWAKNSGYKNGDKISCIEATLKVEGKKIVKIFFSA